MAEESAGEESLYPEESRWFCVRHDIVRGVVLLVHGLNQRPSSWMEMIHYLNSQGLNVYRLALKGHRGFGIGDMETVNARLWEEDFRRGVEELQRAYPNLPRYLVGFSLGGLLALTVQLKDEKQFFSGQLLFAPALAVRHYTRMILPVCRFIPLLPSRSPGSYVANREGTTAAAYRALFQLEADFYRCRNMHLLNIPTKVFMRADDELISYRRTLKLMKIKNLDNWQMIHLTDDKSLYGRWMSFRHLIVDRQSAGEMIWSRIMGELDSFFSTANCRDMRN